jgi:hypothetical protein
MRRRAKPLSRIALVVTLMLAARAATLPAQTPELLRWTLTGAFTGLGGGGLDRWVFGPEVGVRYDLGPRWGIGLRASLPVFDSAPYSDDGAVALDLGPTWTDRGTKSEVGLSAGATAFLVGDGGELTGGGIGPFVAGHATRWLSPGLGLTAGGTLRVGSAGGVFTSLSAGLSLRL